MTSLVENFDERLQEIEAYLALLESFERALQEGPPHLGGTAITSLQQRILYSSVYLQIYNLVEATVTWSVDAICNASSSGQRWRVSDLSSNLKREWVRAKARTHIELSEDKRLNHAVELADFLIQAGPISDWAIEKGRRGNWDEDEIRTMTKRLGCEIQISAEVYSAIKRPIRDDKGALVLVKDLRNRLAHGSLSFAECGDGVTVADLRVLAERTFKYLKEVVEGVKAFIDSYAFLDPACRPQTETNAHEAQIE